MNEESEGAVCQCCACCQVAPCDESEDGECPRRGCRDHDGLDHDYWKDDDRERGE